MLDDLHGHYLFTYLLIYRQPEYRGNSGQGEPPPLAATDVDLVIQSFAAIRKWARSEGGGDEMVSYMANSVMHELKRAGRAEEEQRLFRELMSEVKTPDQVTFAISAYVAREDHASLLAAFDKWAQLTLQDKRKAVPSHYRQQVGYSISQAIGRSGAAKQDTAVLELLDRFLDFSAARSAQERQKTANRPGRRSTARGSYYYNVWYGTQQRGMQINYPAPNEYFDEAAPECLAKCLRSLRSKRRRERPVAASGAAAGGRPAQDKLYRHLAAAYVASWLEDKDTAIQQLTAASELAAQDWLLRLEVARLYLEMQDYEQALAIVDGIHPLDQDTFRERETLALNLAVRLGDQERARGIGRTVVRPAARCRNANPARQPDAAAGYDRAGRSGAGPRQRQAGSRLSALVSLMNAHQSQGRTDVAAEIAYQVLRRSRSAGANPAASGPRPTSDDGSRRAALQVLASAGKLKDMIAATEQQLQRSPQSSQLFDTLAEYYEAAGDTNKSLELQKKLVAERPTDAELGQRYAQRLAASGKHSDACDQYLIVIKQAPQLFGNRSYEIVQIFQQAQRQSDLIALFNEIDLRQLGHPYYIADFTSTLMRDKAQRPAATSLFKKVWEAMPDYRSQMMSSMSDQTLLETDELFDLAKKSILPAPGSLQQRGVWLGIGESNSTSSGGESHSLFQGLVAQAQKSNRLPALREEIAAAITANPGWRAGPLMVAAIDVRLGNVDGVRPVVEQALSEKGEAAIPYYPRWILGQFLETNVALRDLAIRLYEGTLTDEAYNRNSEFQFTPAVRLLNLYVAANRREDAKVLLAKAEKQRLEGGYDPEYAAERRISQLTDVAQHYDRLDFPLDALRLYRDALLAAQSPALGNRRGNSDYYVRSAEQQLKALTARLAAAENPALLQELLAPSEKPGKPVVDLMIGMQRNSRGGLQITSPLVELLMSQQLSPSNEAAMARQIEALQDKYPSDLSLQMIAALGSLRDKDSTRIATTLASLRQAIEQHPLEPLAQGQRANARQREAALTQIALWLVAAESLKVSAQDEIANLLAECATQAARRQSDPQFVTAILVQRSKLALAAGDKPDGTRAPDRALGDRPHATAGQSQINGKYSGAQSGQTQPDSPADAEPIPPGDDRRSIGRGKRHSGAGGPCND